MKKLTALFAILVLLSCSSDPIEPNGFRFDGKLYPVKSLLLQEYGDNQTRLIFTGENSDEFGLPETIVEINVDSPSLEETVNNIATDGLYRFQSEPFFDEDVYDYATTILNSNSSNPDVYEIANGAVNVTKMDDAAVELSVHITRADGAIITGNYLGRYHQ